MSRAKIHILLSTFNGEAYLPDLLASLKGQDHPAWSLFVRDDGSWDATPDILHSFSRSCDIRIDRGANLGAMQSFFTLIRSSAPDAEYWALCDQDDVWKPQKLRRALSKLESIPQTVPAMYCSRLELTDADLTFQGYSARPRKNPGFENALVENIATGSTIVYNRAARSLLQRAEPGSAVMHDWWIYLTVSALGRVIYDPWPGILYRMHGSNEVGQHSGAALLLKRMQRMVRRQTTAPITNQARCFAQIYGSKLTAKKYRALAPFIRGRTLWTRLLFCPRACFYRQAPLETAAVKLLYLLNWL